eukprot:6201713-Pleurochrysis_carterae.AAC.2
MQPAQAANQSRADGVKTTSHQPLMQVGKKFAFIGGCMLKLFSRNANLCEHDTSGVNITGVIMFFAALIRVTTNCMSMYPSNACWMPTCRTKSAHAWDSDTAITAALEEMVLCIIDLVGWACHSSSWTTKLFAALTQSPGGGLFRITNYHVLA